MKTVCMNRDYTYRAGSRVFVQYRAGVTYKRVPEAAARAIINADAGEVVETFGESNDRSVV